MKRTLLKLNKLQISLLLLSTLTIMTGAAVMTILPTMSSHYKGVENIDIYVKLMLALPSLSIALFSSGAGFLIDTLGRLKSLYLGIAIFVIAGVAPFFIYNIHLILVFRFILGIGVGIIMTVNTTLIGDYFDQKSRESLLSIQGAFSALGGILFIMGGALIAQIDYKANFLIYLVPLTFLPLLLKTLYEPEDKVHQDEVEVKLFSKDLILIYITGYFLMSVFYLLPTQMPFLMKDMLNASSMDIGFVITSAMIVSAFASISYKKLRDYISYKNFFIIVFASFALGLLSISYATSLKDFILGGFFNGIALGVMMVNFTSWMLSVTTQKVRAKASGVFVSSVFAGQFSSVLIFQPIIATQGVQGMFFIVSIALFVVALLILLSNFIKIKTF